MLAGLFRNWFNSLCADLTGEEKHVLTHQCKQVKVRLGRSFWQLVLPN